MLSRLKPPSTPMAVVFRRVEPTWRNYIYYVNLAAKDGNEEMAKFMAAYDALTRREQVTILPEQLCDLAGVSQSKVIAAVAAMMWETKQPESVINAAAAHPLVVQATADFARLPAGEKDRELFFRLTGGLPDKKGASIVIHNNPQTANINTPSFAGTSGFKPMDARVIEMGKLLDSPDEEKAAPLLGELEGVLTEDDNEED